MCVCVIEQKWLPRGGEWSEIWARNSSLPPAAADGGLMSLTTIGEEERRKRRREREEQWRVNTWTALPNRVVA